MAEALRKAGRRRDAEHASAGARDKADHSRDSDPAGAAGRGVSTAGDSSPDGTAGELPMPSRKLGLTVMIIAYCCAIWWLQQQDPGSEALPTATDSANLDTVLAAPRASVAFNAHSQMLPAEPSLGFIEIPAGEFLMGSDPAVDPMAYENERWSRTQNQGLIDVPRYYTARYEVTAAQFRAYQRVTGEGGAVRLDGSPADFPVTGVTLPEALAYARWLDGELRSGTFTPGYLREFLAAGARVTLPDEAEWEKAARSVDGRIFPWGNVPRPEMADSGEAGWGGVAAGTDDRVRGIRAVGTVTCHDCAFGIADMSGNVWELTRSPMQSYPFGRDDVDDLLDRDALWVMRGGSFADQIGNTRAAVRGGVDPGVRSNAIGFRLVISTR